MTTPLDVNAAILIVFAAASTAPANVMHVRLRPRTHAAYYCPRATITIDVEVQNDPTGVPPEFDGPSQPLLLRTVRFDFANNSSTLTFESFTWTPATLPGNGDISLHSFSNLFDRPTMQYLPLTNICGLFQVPIATPAVDAFAKIAEFQVTLPATSGNVTIDVIDQTQIVPNDNLGAFFLVNFPPDAESYENEFPMGVTRVVQDTLQLTVVSDCCCIHSSPGCDEMTCQSKVCNSEPQYEPCCNDQWYDYCVTAAENLCMAGMTSLCPAAVCNNSVVEPGEECDPPDGTTCDANCQNIETCAITITDDFEADRGWTVGDAGDNATTGVWVRVDPNGTTAQPEDDHTPLFGTSCWVTGQGTPGGPLGENDVDGGRTTLKSPILDLSSQMAVIRYWRWYSNDTGAAPNEDSFFIDISNDGGTNWMNVQTIGPTGAGTSGDWIFHEFNVADFVVPTSQVRLRFVASDLGAGSIIEAAIDDFEVCTEVIDCNNNGVPDSLDIATGTSENCNSNDIPDECESGACQADCDCGDCDSCSTDQCVNGTCQYAIRPCDDDQYCTVNDACSNNVCGGIPRNCGDANPCTVDACNEAMDTCVHTPTDALCDDMLFCNGTETCDAMMGCQAGSPPCAGPCDEGADACAGACCVASGGCFETGASQCQLAGGSYQGDNTSCNPPPIPQQDRRPDTLGTCAPGGACCFAGSCCRQLTQSVCDSQNGSWQGLSTACDGAACQPLQHLLIGSADAKSVFLFHGATGEPLSEFADLSACGQGRSTDAAIGQDGLIYVSSELPGNAQGVYRYTTAGECVGVFIPEIGATAISQDAEGYWYVGVGEDVNKYDSSGNCPAPPMPCQFPCGEPGCNGDVTGIVVVPTGVFAGQILVAHGNPARSVLRHNPANGAVLRAYDVSQTGKIKFGSDGFAYVADPEVNVVRRLDLQSGDVSIAVPAVPGTDIQGPEALAFDPANGDLLVGNSPQGLVKRFRLYPPLYLGDFVVTSFQRPSFIAFALLHDPVMPTGACCQGTTCVDNSSVTECTSAGGAYACDGALCTTYLCSELDGACCVGMAGTDCIIVDASTGSALQGSFAGTGSTCEDNNGNGTADVCAQPCQTVLDCADVGQGGANGLRDDNCVYWECNSTVCSSTSVKFADMGGAGGSCVPDGSADANDKFHALNCFSDTNFGSPGEYACEPFGPVNVYNVDAGGAGLSCCPDGACDANDAFAALNAFSDRSLCAICPQDSAICVGGGKAGILCGNDAACPGGSCVIQNPASHPCTPPQAIAPYAPRIVENAIVSATASQRTAKAGDLVQVRVFMENAVSQLRGYQMHLGVSGGKTGQLELVDVSIGNRADHVFSNLAHWNAFNVRTEQMLAGLDGAGVPTVAKGYLATYTYRVSPDAAGTFVVDVLGHSDSASNQRTFLFGSNENMIGLSGTRPAAIVVTGGSARSIR